MNKKLLASYYTKEAAERRLLRYVQEGCSMAERKIASVCSRLLLDDEVKILYDDSKNGNGQPKLRVGGYFREYINEGDDETGVHVLITCSHNASMELADKAKAKYINWHLDRIHAIYLTWATTERIKRSRDESDAGAPV